MKRILIVFFTMMLSFSLLHCDDITWSSPPITVSSATLNASDPQIAMDSNGNAVAAWVENGLVKSSNLPVNGSWSTSATLSNSGASSPRIVADAAGNATAVWLEGGVLKTSNQPFNGSWSATATTLVSSGASAPQIAVQASSGDVVVVWVKGSLIQSATKHFNGNWPILPDTISSVIIPSDSPQVAISANGAVIAVWHGVVASVDTVYSATKTLSGAWSLGQAISNALFSSAYPQVAIDPNGNAIAIWYRYNVASSIYSSVVVQSASLSFGGSWTDPVDLSSPGIVNPAHLIARIAIDSIGNAVAAWNTSFDGDRFTVESAVKPVNANWTQPVDLFFDLYAYNLDLAVNASGRAFFVCMVFNPSSSSSLMVQAIESDVDGFFSQMWSPPVTISSGDTSVSDGFPRVATVLVGDNNNAAVVWIDFNGTNDTIQSATGTGLIVLPPPQNSLMVTQSTNVFGPVTEYVNTFTWMASPSSSAVGYLVYRNGVLIDNLFQPVSLQIVDHNRDPNVADTYGVAAYDILSVQSIIVNIQAP